MSVEHTLPVEPLARHLGGERLAQDVPLAPFTTFRIGGPADLFYRAKTADELVRAMQVARDLGVPTLLLGRGANILVGDRGFRGLVVRSEVGASGSLTTCACGRARALRRFPT